MSGPTVQSGFSDTLTGVSVFGIFGWLSLHLNEINTVVQIIAAALTGAAALGALISRSRLSHRAQVNEAYVAGKLHEQEMQRQREAQTATLVSKLADPASTPDKVAAAIVEASKPV